MALIYAFANQKGGVGKTTSAVNMGAFLGVNGRRVLLIDMDPQANATSSLNVDPRAGQPSIYEVLTQGLTLQDTITVTPQVHLDLVPSTPELAGAETELREHPRRHTLLRDALPPILERYDYILIDNPPSLNLLTVNSLAAARHGVIIPVQCEYLALEGLAELRRTIELVRRRLNPDLRIAGVLLTMFDVRTNLSQQVVQEVRQHFPNETFKTIIPRNVRLSEAPSYGEPITSYAPTSAGAQAYAALTQEFLAHSADNNLPQEVPHVTTT